MKSKIININVSLKKLVDQNVLYYKTDCDQDISIMLKKDYGNVFYIYMRMSGTELMPEKFIYYKESTAYLLANYYKDENPLKVYKISITKRGRINLYGTIEEIKKNEFLIDIEQNIKKAKSIKYLIILKNGKTVETIVPYSEQTFYEAVKKNKLNFNQIKNSNIIEYME